MRSLNMIEPKLYIIKKSQKLFADFIFGKSFEYIAVIYKGYGTHIGITNRLKEYYLNSGYSVVIIYANGYSASGGKKRVDDPMLLSDLICWIEVIKDTFSSNSKIYLHGFAYTALSALDYANQCYAVFADNTCLFPTYNYRNIKYKLIKNKSRAEIPEISVPAFFSSQKDLSKETYKVYEHSNAFKKAYIYENFNPDEYINHIDTFIKRLIQPEE